ncbi:DUF3785 family protein [uncultured Clostridium sp.]|uniref:DUF3785 family protein n=1 Tax=uncultured Clostridium sp. TaxID=59620 RepID=UPI0025DCC52C|nr:DUF3785 family protein [uncultured Clostridium sp.]
MKVLINDKEYILDNNSFGGFLNDEENPIKDIDEKEILKILEGKELDFEKAYYSSPCVECKSELNNNLKAYPFYEYHFYLYTKDNKIVWDSFKVEEEKISFTKMKRAGKADNSYIVSLIICAGCGTFEIEIEELEV